MTHTVMWWKQSYFSRSYVTTFILNVHDQPACVVENTSIWFIVFFSIDHLWFFCIQSFSYFRGCLLTSW